MTYMDFQVPTAALEQSLRERQEMIPEPNGRSEGTTSDLDDVESMETASSPKRSRAKRKPKPKVSAIDENLESVNWLLTVPSDENPAPSVGTPSSDADFGYQPPVKKDIAANDAQLTLF